MHYIDKSKKRLATIGGLEEENENILALLATATIQL